MMINLNKQFSQFFPYTVINGIPIRRRKLRKPKIRIGFNKKDSTPIKVVKTLSNRRVRNIK